MLNLIPTLTNIYGHNSDTALHREGYITLWTNYQYIMNISACFNSLNYLELFAFFKWIQTQLHGFDLYLTFVNAPLSLFPVLLQCNEA